MLLILLMVWWQGRQHGIDRCARHARSRHQYWFALELEDLKKEPSPFDEPDRG